MERNRGMKTVALVALFVAVAGITLAYAALNTTLTIKGNAGVDPASWQIIFSNLSTDVEGTGSFLSNPTLSSDNITISGFSGSLSKPGDSIIVNFKIENNGTLDAQITSYTLGSLSYTGSASDEALVSSNMTYTLTYDGVTTAAQTDSVIADGTPVAVNQMLKAGQSVDMELKLTFGGDSVPEDEVGITIGDTTIVYTEA